jgi:membrane-associated phospholipid phosphatase
MPPPHRDVRPAVRELASVDRAVYASIARVATPTLDRRMRTLSVSADHSKLWFGFAAGLALAGRSPERRAAAAGVGAIGIASAVANLGLKQIGRRTRPDRHGASVPELRHVPMPRSLSFPSGHSASGFAFATAVGQLVPLAAPPLRFVAAMVAYSRVHTGVHYPGDVIVGSLVGALSGGAMAGLVTRRRLRRRARRL